MISTIYTFRERSVKSESDFFPHAEDPQKAVYILVGTLQMTKIEES